jgi:hypothetical protein
LSFDEAEEQEEVVDETVLIPNKPPKSPQIYNINIPTFSRM